MSQSKGVNFSLPYCQCQEIGLFSVKHKIALLVEYIKTPQDLCSFLNTCLGNPISSCRGCNNPHKGEIEASQG